MNITEKIIELEANIQSFIADKNLPILNPQKNYPISLDGENQCVFTVSKQTLIYLIAHEDVQLMEDFLNLSQNTMNKIKKIRSFTCGMYEDTKSFSHKRLKIKIEPATSIEFSLIGSDLGGLRIELKANEISVTWVYSNNVSVMYSDDDDIEQKINQALDLVIPAILNEFGFADCTEDSEEVIDFMNKSTDELMVEHFAKFGFDYVQQNELIANACAAASISLEDFMDYNKKNKEPEANITIPYKMMSILPKIITDLSSDASVNSKFKQIMGLVSFYDYLQSTKTNAILMFKEYSKVDLAPSASMHSEYFSVFMGSVLMLTLGNQLKPDPEDPDHKFDAVSENGYSYMFDIYIYNDKNPDVSYKYYCNDLDYIYDIILNKIRNLINATIFNTTETLTARHIEVFNMARV